MKRVRFKAGRPSTKEHVWISAMRSAKEGQVPYLDFDLSLLVGGTFWRTLMYGDGLGCLLAGPQIITVLSNPNFTQSRVVCLCIIGGGQHSHGHLCGLRIEEEPVGPVPYRSSFTRLNSFQSVNAVKNTGLPENAKGETGPTAINGNSCRSRRGKLCGSRKD